MTLSDVVQAGDHDVTFGAGITFEHEAYLRVTNSLATTLPMSLSACASLLLKQR